MVVFGGNSNMDLVKKIVEHLDHPLGLADVGCFSDGEVSVEIQENVRGKDVFIIQSTCKRASDNLMEFLVLADAVRRSSAMRITAVFPYFGYARQDRRPRSRRVAISAKVVADMIASVGVDRALMVDLHADQIQGFFSMPVDNIYGSGLLSEHMEIQAYQNPLVVSPDHGGVVRARAVAKRLRTDLAIIDKRRVEANKIDTMNVIGDVEGRTCILVDDIVDTAGTLCEAALALKRDGADAVYSYCTHPVLSGEALERLDKSCLDGLVVTNTIPLSEEARSLDKIHQLDMSYLLAEAIRRISHAESISAMFQTA